MMFDALDFWENVRVSEMRVCQVNEVFQNRGNRRPVHAAAIHGNLALLNILHHLGADLNVRDSKLMTPMMYAAEKNHYEVVVFLMKNNCSPYLKNEDGKTALACAAKSGSLAASKAIIELTLKPRPLMDVVDRGGWTAMVWAAEFGSFPVVKYLLSHGADWRIKDLDGNMILHWSAYGGNKDIMEALLNVGCPLDLQNNDGDTALHIGARRKTVDCVNLLLRHGASLSVKNKAGHTPRHAAALVSDSIRDLLGLSEVINSDAIDVRKTEYGKNVLSGVHRPVSTVPEAAVKSFVDTDVSRGLERFRVPWFNSVDNEKFPVDSFAYIADNSSAFPMDTKIASTVNMKCNCSGMCDDRCACVVEIKEVDGEEATRYTYCMNGLCTPEVLRDYPSSYIVECGTSCGCNPMFCNNHVTQQGLGIMVQIFKTSTRRRGWGLRSIEDVKQRQFVCQYAGEWITRTEAVRRNDMSYTLEFHVEDALLLDAKYSGNVGRFINHSCKPNLALIRVMKDKREHRFPRACLFALRDISAGEELTLNYGEQFWKSVPYSCRCREVDCVAPPPTCSPVKVKSQLLKPKAKKMKPSLGSADICMG
ncbi:unnamed protein product [Notodromas monacha]|uniref:SET domain-containing protein n=1 Tax=Notodromas monacha TaxID=399045 RepID=A0A7R9G9P8_9CRUS|nr:unnamed protein product [Notodromas monacha]CAG0913148.1 unnamed protein product [Notodromas monacha]